jgi:hypothetical protein
VRTRDAYMLGVLAVLGVLAAFVFVALKPKLQDLDTAKKNVTAAQGDLQKARQEADRFAQARLEFPHAYTTIARLGKAVPPDVDEASLIFQLDKAAKEADVSFESLDLNASSSSPSGGTAPPTGASSSSGSSASQGGAGGQAATQTVSASSDTLGSAPADATATAAVPTGASAGSADLRVMHFELAFTGSFFKLESFLHNLSRLVSAQNGGLAVSGRLVTIDAISFDTEGKNVTLAATTYLIPTGEGLFAGATSTGPAGVQQTASQSAPTSSGAAPPPTAAVTGP